MTKSEARTAANLARARRWQISISAAALGGSAAASFLPNLLKKWTDYQLTVGEQVLLTACLYIVFLLVDLQRQVWLLRSGEEYQALRIEQLKEGDEVIGAIGAHFHALWRDSPNATDLFVAHFVSEMRKLEEQIKGAAQNGSIEVEADHFLRVDNVLSTFGADIERSWRFTWLIEHPDDKMFEHPAWRRYFREITEMARKRQLRSIKTLFVIDDSSFISANRVERLLCYYRDTKGLECRVVTKKVMEQICKDSSSRRITVDQACDFGVYGNSLVYINSTYSPTTRGLFCKNAAMIAEYGQLFDALWNDPTNAQAVALAASDRVTIDMLLAQD
jgi:hypothetical protein